MIIFHLAVRALLSDTDISLTFLIVLLVIILTCVIMILVFMCCSWFNIDKKRRQLFEPIIEAIWMNCYRTCLCRKQTDGDGDESESEAEGEEEKAEDQVEGDRLGADSAPRSPSADSAPRSPCKTSKTSKNGFTVKMAEKYVNGLKEMVRFAQGDTVISGVLNKLADDQPDVKILSPTQTF